MVRHTDPGRLSRGLAWLGQPLPAPPAALRRGPFQRGAFDSKLRSPRLTSLLGLALAVAFTLCFVTGLISHFIQQPPAWFGWPSRPVGLYRVTQGVHVVTGLASVPLLGAKLWSVFPRLFSWPPARDVAQAIERVSIAALVAAALFQLFSGILNISRWYTPMPFFFTAGHFWSAWLAIGALIAHIGVKLPIIRTALTRNVDSSTSALERGDLKALADRLGEFDELLLGQLRNGIITDLLDRLQAHLKRIGRVAMSLERLGACVDEHRAILRAIAARDVEAAQNLLRRHLRHRLADQLAATAPTN